MSNVAVVGTLERRVSSHGGCSGIGVPGSGRNIHRHVMGPGDLENWNPNLVGGDIAGGRTDQLRMLIRPGLNGSLYHAGPGLYLGSSATPPGPGVHGMGGFHAARAVLKNED